MLGYVDAGLGSFLLQLVVGGVVAVVLALRKGRSGLTRVLRLVGGRARRSGDPEEDG